jgi:Fe-S-cluster-containing hydrogenase component 2
MTDDDLVYRKLQQYLDRLPSGFPRVDSGLDIKLLKRFFTPQEAAIALQLSMQPEPLARIYGRIRNSGISVAELKNVLDTMLCKGTILTFEEDYRETRYANAEFTAGGIYNFQINRLSPELITDYQQYQAERRSKARPGAGGSLPLRTVPVEKSLPLPEKYTVSDYDSIRKIVENASGKLAVANCICRQTADLTGGGCAVTGLRETCLLVGHDHAKRHVDMGVGRYVSKEEALEILHKAQEAGLVIQPENSLRPEAICCCCGDCCVFLKMMLKHPRPVELYITNYNVKVDPALCTGCNVCVEKCQLGARALVDGVAQVNLDRCIGCGNCVVLCPSGANKMVHKEPEKVPPKDKVTANRAALARKVGRWNMLKIRAKMLLGMKV